MILMGIYCGNVRGRTKGKNRARKHTKIDGEGVRGTWVLAWEIRKQNSLFWVGWGRLYQKLKEVNKNNGKKKMREKGTEE